MNSYNKNYNHKSIQGQKNVARVRGNFNVSNPYNEKKINPRYLPNTQRRGQSPVISGYFVREKSYKEIIISRINATLCGILGFLILVCLVSYYFVVENEMKLRQLSKETIALNYDNADMQNQLDNLQSFSNVDKQVSKSNILKRANQVIELSAADLPDVSYEKAYSDATVNKYLGY